MMEAGRNVRVRICKKFALGIYARKRIVMEENATSKMEKQNAFAKTVQALIRNATMIALPLIAMGLANVFTSMVKLVAFASMNPIYLPPTIQPAINLAKTKTADPWAHVFRRLQGGLPAFARTRNIPIFLNVVPRRILVLLTSVTVRKNVLSLMVFRCVFVSEATVGHPSVKIGNCVDGHTRESARKTLASVC